MSKFMFLIMTLLVAFSLTACASPQMGTSIERETIVEAPASMGIPGESPDPEVFTMNVQTGFTSEELPAERLVIRNADLVLVVSDPVQSAEKIGTMAAEMGGYVVSSTIHQETYDDGIQANQATITIRIPTENLDEALRRIKEDAKEIRSDNLYGEDVTQEYTDLQSRLRNLEAAEEELRRIMEDARDAEDVLDIYEHLRRVREEIEVIKGRIQYFENASRLSAVNVVLLPDVAESPLQIGRWQPQGTAKAALEALIRALKFIAEVVIWSIIYILPIAAIVAIPIWLVIRTYRRVRPPKRKQTPDIEKE